MKHKIMVVDDDKSILEMMKDLLSKERGFDVYTANNGKKALQVIKQINPHVLILDVMMPDMSGYEVCTEIRKTNEALPIIFLTGGKKGHEDKAAGFLSGCDDYMIKPFNIRELIFRIKAIIKRSYRISQPESLFAIDSESLNIKINGKKIEDLTQTEFKILSILLTKYPDIITREDLMKSVWSFINPSTNKSLEVYIQRLRKKLGEQGNCIETIPTKGYRFTL